MIPALLRKLDRIDYLTEWHLFEVMGLLTSVRIRGVCDANENTELMGRLAGRIEQMTIPFLKPEARDTLKELRILCLLGSSVFQSRIRRRGIDLPGRLASFDQRGRRARTAAFVESTATRCTRGSKTYFGQPIG